MSIDCLSVNAETLAVSVQLSGLGTVYVWMEVYRDVMRSEVMQLKDLAAGIGGRSVWCKHCKHSSDKHLEGHHIDH
jgi:hypothetical protein